MVQCLGLGLEDAHAMVMRHEPNYMITHASYWAMMRRLTVLDEERSARRQQDGGCW